MYRADEANEGVIVGCAVEFPAHGLHCTSNERHKKAPLYPAAACMPSGNNTT